METGHQLAKKATLTPKAIINQKFGNSACYVVEEVREPLQTDCPGLAIPLKGPCLYCCTLQLPEFSVKSGCFKKKRDAEQSAAELALLQLGIHPSTNDHMQISPWDELTSRILYLFADEFLTGTHPTSAHFRAVTRRRNDLNGFIPIPVIAVCDKLANICKSIDPMVEQNPCLAINLILKAAASLTDSIRTYEGRLWLRRLEQYPPEVLEPLRHCGLVESISVQVLFIPHSLKDAVEARTLNIASDGYYMDAIALELGLQDASEVLVSRTVGKTSSEMRMYFPAPGNLMLDCFQADQVKDQTYFNHRASCLSGQDIYGSAVMASVGYTWRSADLFHEDLTLKTYLRIIVSKMPSGIYKLSRKATLTAELPVLFTSRTYWRGSLPRELLYSFCRQHRLSEPVLCMESLPGIAYLSGGPCEKIEDMRATTNSNSTVVDKTSSCDEKSSKLNYSFRCAIKIYKHENLILEYVPKETHKKQEDAVHSSSLSVLLWFDKFLKEPDMPLEGLQSAATELNMNIEWQSFQKEFALCQFVYNMRDGIEAEFGTARQSDRKNKLVITPAQEVSSSQLDNGAFGVLPTNGSLVCISYAVSLVIEGENGKELLEYSNHFEFEIGVGAVLPHLEVLVTQLSVNQSACFHMEPPDLILTAAGDCLNVSSLVSLESCYLEYFFTLLKVTEPLEDRMEQAFFSPPLAKQRVEFAVSNIRKSSATTLIDFGCGSGSLLDSLLDYQTGLEKIVGVDISQKSLARAAKMLHSKLCRESDAVAPSKNLRSAILYEGSIIDNDSRLSGFDIGTCLEVIEHMEEDDAFKFGDVVLSYFRPKLLIVSTPNY